MEKVNAMQERLDISGKIKEIEKFAKKNENQISLFVVQDIVRNKAEGVDEDLLNQILYQIREKGIQILPVDADEGYGTDSNDSEKFIPSDVSITQTPLSVSTIMERLENREYDLDPAFQRHAGLWDKQKQSQLIESLMLKIPLPAFYFDASKEDEWVVIDGLQRLTAFKNYLVGNEQEDGTLEKYEFEGLQYLTDFNGKTFDDLPRQYIRRIKESSIVAYTVAKGTPEAIVFNIFQRINTGGVHLNDQEIRQALYSGKGTELIKDLAERQEFKAATQYAIKPDRMMDREYVLRFISFTELDYRHEYKGNIDSFLIKGLKKANDYTEDDIERITGRFIAVMDTCHDIFGKFAFRRYNKEFRRGPINKAVFELWSICLSELNTAELNKMKSKKEEVLYRFGELLADKNFAAALKSGDQYSFMKRVERGRALVKELL